MATIIGIAAAMGSKWLDAVINWTVVLVMGIPHLVLLILVSLRVARFNSLLVGLAVTHWTSLARLMQAKCCKYVPNNILQRPEKLGHNSTWILIKHILPHMIPQFIIGLILLFPHAILHESSLSFLGFGLPPEQPAIGIILSESMKYLSSGMWWLAVFPGLLLLLLVILFEKLGDNLRKIIDPYSAHE
ncbi:MAG: ABC transporter permease [Acutalibacteraceae bacterium]